MNILDHALEQESFFFFLLIGTGNEVYLDEK